MKAKFACLAEWILQPKLLFTLLLVVSLVTSYFFPFLVSKLVGILSSDRGSEFIARIIIGVFSALFISAYITEKRKGRAPQLVNYAQNYFTALPLALGFYTLARWIFLDTYSNADFKFLPYLDKLGVTTLIFALIMLLNEVGKLTLAELIKLKSSKKGVQVQVIPDDFGNHEDNVEPIQVANNNPNN